MSKTLKLVFLIILLFACSVALFVLNKGNTHTDEAETIVSFDPKEIKAIAYTSPKGEKLSFSRKSAGDNWIYDENPDFPLNSNIIESMTQSLSQINSYKTIPQTEELSAYGIEENPFEILFFSGDKLSFSFGKKSDVDGYRYLSVGDKNIYMTEESVNNRLDHSLMDMVITETLPDMPDISAFVVSVGDKSYKLEKILNSSLSYSCSHIWFYNAGEAGYLALDTESTDSFIRQVSGMEWSSCVTYNADEEQLKALGFDENCLKATVIYNTENKIETNVTDTMGVPFYLTEMWGDSFTVELFQPEDNTIYAHIPGSGYVYTVDSGIYNNLVGISFESLQPDELIGIKWDEIARLDVAMTSFKTGEVLSASFELTDLGASLYESLFSWYELIEYTTATGKGSNRAPEGDCVFSMKITREREYYSQVTVSLYPTQEGSYLISLYAPKNPDDIIEPITRLDIDSDKTERIINGLEDVIKSINDVPAQ